MSEPGPTEQTAGDTAVGLFESGYNCAEAIVRALAPSALREVPALQRVATAFGAGIARRGLTCGCLTGCAIAAGLRLGRTVPDDEMSKEITYGVVEEVMDRFAATFGTFDCRALTGVDFTQAIAPEEKQRVMTQTCRGLVRFVAEVGAEAIAAAVKEEA
ncbi:MAG: C-GCAxxG-C-C family protein [Thermoanaerobaculales bacterium]